MSMSVSVSVSVSVRGRRHGRRGKADGNRNSAWHLMALAIGWGLWGAPRAHQNMPGGIINVDSGPPAQSPGTKCAGP